MKRQLIAVILMFAIGLQGSIAALAATSLSHRRHWLGTRVRLQSGRRKYSPSPLAAIRR
jgi:hypothetical protein